jgi:hypothetical protein
MSRTVPGGKASVGVMPGFSDTIVLMYDDRVGVVRDGSRWSFLDGHELQPIYVSSRPVSYRGPTLERLRTGGTTISYGRMLHRPISIVFGVSSPITSTAALHPMNRTAASTNEDCLSSVYSMRDLPLEGDSASGALRLPLCLSDKLSSGGLGLSTR